MPKTTVEQTVNEVFALFEQHGTSNYIGEQISQWEHACQAAMLARWEGYDDEVILAALLHDIGHLCSLNGEKHPQMAGYGTMEHEKLGADYLRVRGFSSKVTQLVESHVAAKRYLCFAQPNYFNSLSEASQKTLAFQGGPMTPSEAKQMEQNPLFATIIRMRSWDEMAKEEDLALPDVSVFRELAQKHLIQQNFSIAPSL